MFAIWAGRYDFRYLDIMVNPNNCDVYITFANSGDSFEGHIIRFSKDLAFISRNYP
jgi:hypothetical protein